MVFEFHEQIRRLASREERIESVASRACRNVTEKAKSAASRACWS